MRLAFERRNYAKSLAQPIESNDTTRAGKRAETGKLRLTWFFTQHLNWSDENGIRLQAVAQDKL
ncbi:MAG: hypothetical protein ABL921_26035 [Pirellula sp.]